MPLPLWSALERAESTLFVSSGMYACVAMLLALVPAGGHIVLGGCISGSEELISKIRQYHHVIGGVLNPNAAYMILRGMRALHLHVPYQNSTAIKMAQFLEKHPKVHESNLVFPPSGVYGVILC
ncbi:hypothetical protein BHE74_00026365 [Ensete ventricosum]|nr:hypothetical protein BHE74_00026365 [Ensete ventricosum]